ncbi:hypothetical protein MRX96_058472 [Rhipicephalus microplus]
MHHSVSSGRCATPRAVIRSSPSREADPLWRRNGNNGAQCEPVSIHPLPPRRGTFVAGAPGDFVRPLYAAATRVRLFENAGGARALGLVAPVLLAPSDRRGRRACRLLGGVGQRKPHLSFRPPSLFRARITHVGCTRRGDLPRFAVDSVVLTFLWKRSFEGARRWPYIVSGVATLEAILGDASKLHLLSWVSALPRLGDTQQFRYIIVTAQG